MNKEILQLIEKRLEVGANKYKLELDPFDGRDWIQESLEELLDACVYLSTKLIQIQHSIKTTADEYNLDSDEEDVQLAYSIVRSNEEVEGVFMQEGKVTQIDYVNNTQEEYVRISDINKEIARNWKKEKK